MNSLDSHSAVEGDCHFGGRGNANRIDFRGADSLAVVPALSIRFPLAENVLPASKSSYTEPIVVRGAAWERVSGTAPLELPTGWSSVPVSAEVAFERDGEEATVSIQVRPAEDASGEYTLGAVVSVAGQHYREGFETVSATPASDPTLLVCRVYRRNRRMSPCIH